MCTCGIDIATQQDTPATHSSVCSVPGDRPIERARAGGRVVGSARCNAGGAAAQQQRERQHGREAEHPMPSTSRASRRCDEVLHDRRPDRAGEIVAGWRRSRRRCRGGA